MLRYGIKKNAFGKPTCLKEGQFTTDEQVWGTWKRSRSSQSQHASSGAGAVLNFPSPAHPTAAFLPTELLLVQRQS